MRKLREYAWLKEVEVLGDVDGAKYGLLLTEAKNPRIGIHWIDGNFPHNQWFVMPIHTNYALLHGVIADKFPDKYERVREFLFPDKCSQAA